MSPLYARIVAALIPNKQLRDQVRELLLGKTDWLINLLRTESGINYMAMAATRLPLHDLVKNYALVGELLQILKPYNCIGATKIRIGNNNDGGYIMIAPRPEEKIAYSFGISDESPWDLEMATQGLKVYQYDGTIDSPPDKHPNLFFINIIFLRHLTQANLLKILHKFLTISNTAMNEISSYKLI